ncbi:Protein CBG27766 [Caenorhabditis briggsae]|uniref:Protein CBG27766 n=2 Tax=Caenorhabditis briggsae TaxID=6238 RepID=B6II03_CAEBR|nr:Protein CBG27766 [Caenorhabditis briggsae]ULT82841.1 hypothetical protein L3Y34_012227 [Caenorhabditis briggsae]CAR99533.1 Protein CBG27766 [Caenorhabditis briggsae]
MPSTSNQPPLNPTSVNGSDDEYDDLGEIFPSPEHKEFFMKVFFNTCVFFFSDVVGSTVFKYQMATKELGIMHLRRAYDFVSHEEYAECVKRVDRYGKMIEKLSVQEGVIVRYKTYSCFKKLHEKNKLHYAFVENFGKVFELPQSVALGKNAKILARYSNNFDRDLITRRQCIEEKHANDRKMKTLEQKIASDESSEELNEQIDHLKAEKTELERKIKFLWHKRKWTRDRCREAIPMVENLRRQVIGRAANLKIVFVIDSFDEIMKRKAELANPSRKPVKRNRKQPRLLPSPRQASRREPRGIASRRLPGVVGVRRSNRSRRH